MRVFLTTILVCFYSISISQSISENDIKKLAQGINDKLRSTDIGNGVTVRGCFAYGRTLVYQYNVTEDWYPTENMKEDLIANFKEAGYAERYFNNDINVDFHYYFGNKLKKKISIKSNEFSNLNFSLGDYISIRGHPKAKGVDLKIKQPIGWELKEGNRPNIVKKFVYKKNMYAILIRDNMMFLSRNEAKELLNDEEYVNEFVSDTNSFLRDAEVLNHKIVTIDTYPALEYTVRGNQERFGHNIKIIMKAWIIFYEDKLVWLLCYSTDSKEFNTLENLYLLITTSIVFPEQYN